MDKKEIDVFTGLEMFKMLYNGELKEGDRFTIVIGDNIGREYTVKKGVSDEYYLENSDKKQLVISLLTDKNICFKKVEKQIDWSKVPINTKVQVRDYDNEEWLNRYFIGIVNGDVLYKYITSDLKIDDKIDVFEKDEFIGNTIINLGVKWRQCRIHNSVKIKEEWYKKD